MTPSASVAAASRMLPARPFIDHPGPAAQPPPPPPPSQQPPPQPLPASAGPPTRRKLPEIPKFAKMVHRPAIPPEPHYPSSFHASFDEGHEGGHLGYHHGGSNSHLSSSSATAVPAQSHMNPVYESYHQQLRQHQLTRQHSSPMGSRQLPMAPFGHRRTASSGNFVPETSPGKQ